MPKYLDHQGLIHYNNKIQENINKKVDKVPGKTLSTNDYTTAEKKKLEGIEEGAQKNKKTIILPRKFFDLSIGDTTEQINLALGGPQHVLEVIKGINNSAVEFYYDIGYGEMNHQDYNNSGARGIIKVEAFHSNDFGTYHDIFYYEYEGVLRKIELQLNDNEQSYQEVRHKTWIDLTPSDSICANKQEGSYEALSSYGGFLLSEKKVDKIDGKGLSSNDFDNTYKNKLDGIAAGAEVNVQADWDSTSGDSFIKNKPAIPTQTYVDDNLTSNDSTHALSARQGKILNETKQEKIITIPFAVTRLFSSSPADKITEAFGGIEQVRKVIDAVHNQDGEFYVSITEPSDESSATTLKSTYPVSNYKYEIKHGREYHYFITINPKKNTFEYIQLRYDPDNNRYQQCEIYNESISPISIIDNLQSNSSDSVLSAKQGKILNEAKVNKVDGKGLSTNDYTTIEKEKLKGIAAGAEVNVQSDWNAVNGDAFIKNKPTIPTNNNQLTNGAGYITSSSSISGNAATATNATSADKTKGILTIQKNGKNINTFNGSQNVTANIEVPTITNSLTSTSTISGLSANQGKWLNDNKVEDLTISASVSNTVGVPKVEIVKGGSAKKPTYDFIFTNIKGETGPEGPKGETGAQGLTGVRGPEGPKGNTGAKGETGAQGPKGDTGATGSQGIKGDTGARGPIGETGATGKSAYQVWLSLGNSGTEQDFINSLKGAKGDTGARGLQGPAGKDGSNGAKGETGPEGPQGPRGLPGKDGSNGSNGAKGDKGETGAQGPRGLQGEQGLKGDTGPRGPQGLPGKDGADGARGPEGPQGPKGDAGVFSKTEEIRLLKLMYQVGDIKMTTNNTNPSTYLGFGTWVLWGSGRVPVGVDTAQTEFNSVEKTGGEKTHKLTQQELPRFTPKTTNEFYALIPGGGSQEFGGGNARSVRVDFNTIGGDQPHNNLQPYITCYMWKRTA